MRRIFKLIACLAVLYSSAAFAAVTASGDGSTLVTTTGAQTNGDCVKIDAQGNHIPAGAPCGAGGGGTGTVFPGVAGHMAYYNSAGSTVQGISASGFFDQAYCSTVGYVIVRLTGAWTCSKAMPIHVSWWGTNSAAISSALAVANVNGSRICFDPGVTYTLTSTITLGNGTASAVSTINGIALDSCSGTPGWNTGTGNYAIGTGAVLKWNGVSNGNMIDILGPTTGMSVKNLVLDANNLAGVGIRFLQGSYGDIIGNLIINYKGWAMYMTTYCPSFTSQGTGWNRIEGNFALFPSGTGASGIYMGGCATSPYPDTTQNVFFRNLIGFSGNVNTEGLLIDYADGNTFIDTLVIEGSGTGGADIVFQQQPAPLAAFPYANVFQQWQFQPLGISGASGTGGNYFLLGSNAGGTHPSMPYVHGMNIDGTTW